MASTLAYKPHQGYWTRLCSAIGFGIVVAGGAMWLWDQLSILTYGDVEPIIVQGAVASVVLLLGAALIYFMIYMKRSSSEFLIATEGEMRKVNWSSKREIFGSTWVVIGISVLIAAILFVVDLGFGSFFRAIGVLHG